MKKILALILSSLLIFSGCGLSEQRDNEYRDVTRQDTREDYKRSADLQGLVVSVEAYSIIYSDFRGEKPQGRGYFFIVDMSLYNSTDSPRSFDPNPYVYVVTEAGAYYRLDRYGADQFDGLNEPIGWIGPRKRQMSRIIFNMPTGTRPDFLVIEQRNTEKSYSIDIPGE